MRKVLNVRTHVGGLHGKTSYDAVKDDAKMEMMPYGVLIEMTNRTTVMIPWPNCIEVILGDEVVAEEPKRGPGRPAGVKS